MSSLTTEEMVCAKLLEISKSQGLSVGRVMATALASESRSRILIYVSNEELYRLLLIYESSLENLNV